MLVYRIIFIQIILILCSELGFAQTDSLIFKNGDAMVGEIKSMDRGVVPGYIVGISDNPFNLGEGDFNRFQVAGRVGAGVDVLFLFLEVGYQYGFIDLLKDQFNRCN